MNKRERVLNAMQLKPVDRPPVGFWFHFPADQAYGDACVQAHLDYYNRTDVDMVKLMCDSYFDYPNQVAKDAKDPSDWYRMKPLGEESAFIQEQVERAKAVKAGLRDDTVVIYTKFAPFSLLRFGASDALIMRHLREDPMAVMYALDIVAKDAALLSELLVAKAGIDGIYYCVQGGEKNRMTTEEYKQFITPSDLAVLEHANRFSLANVLHCCGWAGIPNHLEAWQNYPAKVINWACFIEKMNLSQGKDFFGGKCVLGGFDNRPCGVLFSGTKDEVVSYTKALVEQVGTTGVILGADCTLPAAIDPARISWVVDTVKGMA